MFESPEAGDGGGFCGKHSVLGGGVGRAGPHRNSPDRVVQNLDVAHPSDGSGDSANACAVLARPTAPQLMDRPGKRLI
jgi:hypothetical protein